MPTYSERQELAKQFADHVARMQRCLHAAGHHVTEDDIVRAWVEYSSNLCAGWLGLPDDDAALFDILRKHLPTRTDDQGTVWHATIKGAGDGSGDGILDLPDELLARMGWTEGDLLTIEKTDSGDLLLRRAEK
ncbi:MAG TPA: hypothetical protein VM512_10245 [Burkholderiaceae bacterium]|nr:hypothetical protein [Burkholderiaceae bacterium]